MSTDEEKNEYWWGQKVSIDEGEKVSIDEGKVVSPDEGKSEYWWGENHEDWWDEYRWEKKVNIDDKDTSSWWQNARNGQRKLNKNQLPMMDKKYKSMQVMN